MSAIPTDTSTGDRNLLRSAHPGAKALRRTGFYLIVFTLPTVLLLTEVLPDPMKGRGDLVMWLALAWMMIGMFGPIMVLWFSGRVIGEYLGFFPTVRRSVGILMLLGAAVLGVLGYLGVTDPTVQSRRGGAPFVFAAALLVGGWRMLRGKSSTPTG